MSIEEIKEKICDHYCRFPYDLPEDKLEEECKMCPLNELKAETNKPRFILHSDGKIEQIIEPCGDVLDKIKTEMEQIPSELTADGRRMIRRGSVFQIIDKYRKEQE